MTRVLVSARLAGDCVCGYPVIAHFDTEDNFIPCAQLAAQRGQCAPKPVLGDRHVSERGLNVRQCSSRRPRLRLVHSRPPVSTE